MAETVYEGMFIFDSNRFGRDQAGVVGQVEEMISEAGGEILASRLWEERRLAYPINGQRKGTYWLTYFRVEGEKINAMNRRCEISDSVLRHLFLKVDPRLVDTLVSHATETAKPEEPEEAEPVAAGDTAGDAPGDADADSGSDD